MEIVPFHNELRRLFHSLGTLVGSVYFRLDPIDLFGISALLNEIAVIFRIVLLLKCGELVKAIDKKSFSFKIGIAERSANGIHSV